MNIGITCPASIPATQFGGIMFLALDVASELKKIGHKVTLYTTDLDFADSKNSFNKNLSRVEEYKGIIIKRSHVYAKIKLFFINPGLYGIIKNDRPEILHAIGIRGFQSFIAALISKRCNIPLVVSDQGGLHTHPDARNTGLKKILYRLQKPLIKMIIKQATKIIVANEYEREIFSKYCGTSKLVMIENGIDVAKIQENQIDFKNKYNLSKYLLFLGRFAHVKGPDILLQAIRELKKTNRLAGYTVVMMGSDFGYKKRFFDMINELDIKQDVLVIENPPRDIVISAYHGCQFLVLPSRWEMSPLTPLEGFACKKPAISTNAHGIPHVIKNNENGLLFEEENHLDLAEKIAFLLENQEKCKEFGMNGYYKVVSENTKDKMGKEITKLYEEIIATRNYRA